ncbi:bifunctional serine/threonine-protein kinase/formylglycine-generating enzyme family protein [Aliikangiella sp. IMCC44359]|uniref:bifunctional serine/threonine-protein kinase/formylglycine-generating enzyme family protein n=1 Tax=Aliikangiella sp. IMCC44359 TaxID=3459125 RepID=UPI00403AB52F
MADSKDTKNNAKNSNNNVADSPRTIPPIRNNGDDSTRVSASSRPNNQANDKTRIIKNRQADKVKPNIAQSTSANQANKTRVAKAKIGGMSNDKTQIAKPRPTKNNQQDKTQIQKKGLPNKDQSNRTQILRNKKTANSDTTVFQAAQTRLKKTTAKASDDSSTKMAPQNKRSVNKVSTTREIDSIDSGLLKKRFILEKVLGAGGMGVVYKAKDLVKVEAGDKDPYLAIKVLTEEFKEHPEAFIALQRESRKTQRIAHPNIVNVHDFDKDGDTVFMTMEYLEGKPLDQLIRQYKSTGLPTDDAMNILKNISRALIYAHDQDIIHSDFKPGNIFVTDKGVTKVFDFGIARAVAKAEHYDDNAEDKTIFDAGDLGALTPSYASYEMLEGMEPDVRDDIYALGCVAYELFTGMHPFNKIPADEAKRQKLKPKRINHITRRQWKAIEKALSFKREDRVPTVKEFLRLISKVRTTYTLPILIVLSVLAFTSAYFQFFRETPTSVSETEIRSELEYNIRLENYRNTIDSLLKPPQFSPAWEDDLWEEIQGIRKLLKTSDTWLNTSTNTSFKEYLQASLNWHVTTEETIYNHYIDKIKEAKRNNLYARATSLINNAYRYTENTSALDEQMKLLNVAIADKKKLEEEKRLADEAARKKELIAQSNIKISNKPKPKTSDQIKTERFKVALNNASEQLKCQSRRLNMRNLDTAVQKLRSINKNRYAKLENDLIQSLSDCIKRIAKHSPERAIESRKYALRIFRNNKILSSIVIIPRDPCDKSLAGLGAQGKRATCRDTIENIGNGPDLVVIPAKKGIPAFAIGKYEVSVAEFNMFCKVSTSCNEIQTTDAKLPIAKVSFKVVEKYLKWLSKKTKKKYRLPTKNEWLYAAKGRHVSLDPNRNCKLNTRGISRGDTFVRHSIGAQNSWGLVNYVGNASEWVYDKGRKLIAIGGAYNIPMEECNVSTFVAHNGKADSFTGFRVLRELR